MKKSEVPEFGLLNDVTVVLSGMSIAAPFAGAMFAENGADVIWVENPRGSDVMRSDVSFGAVQDRRNMRSILLNPTVPDGKEAILKLLKTADIFIEGSRGGTWAGWGLDDDTLLEANPQLVIVHISGYGQTGDSNYVNRASWDAIGQAFGGYVTVNGFPDQPMIAKPLTCDYITALFATWSAMAGLHKARNTGQGEVVDVAQFEVLARVLSDGPLKYMNWGKEPVRTGITDPLMAGYQPVKCKDGRYIIAVFVGATALTGGLKLLGFERGSELFPMAWPCVVQGTPGAEAFNEKFPAWCMERTAEEAAEELRAAGVAVELVMDFDMMENNSHYQAREVFMEWEDRERGPVKGFGFMPRFKNSPQQLWRSTPIEGEDGADILEELGYDDSEIKELLAAGAVAEARPKAKTEEKK